MLFVFFNFLSLVVVISCRNELFYGVRFGGSTLIFVFIKKGGKKIQKLGGIMRNQTNQIYTVSAVNIRLFFKNCTVSGFITGVPDI